MNERVSTDFPQDSTIYAFFLEATVNEMCSFSIFIWISGGWIDDTIIMLCIMLLYLFYV